MQVGTGIPLVVDEWRAKRTQLCELEILNKGSIEDQIDKAMEVDFANEQIGGGTLTGGKLQVVHLTFHVAYQDVTL